MYQLLVAFLGHNNYKPVPYQSILKRLIRRSTVMGETEQSKFNALK